ncbi:tetratricopeptide repeat protein [Streptomyces hirsutus]|uniref:tetratricopeptide repeat protein n=1 Tax=Streptomyces hirsutus TaxID=35620 RepID=UPI003864B493|nr:tetratricopeptide repeat protein [Streptomyces hirsutus]
MAVGYVADGGQVAYYAAPPPAVTWPHQVGVLPRQADCFQGRTAVEQLEQAVAHGGTAVLCQVLSGMGGVGKTQLAAHHARQVWATGGVDLLVWISATTREAVISTYAQAAAEVLGADLADPERAAGALLAWLEPKPGTTERRWLVVLDDVADPADLRGLWPPTSPQGRTLVTTRRRDAALAGSGRRLVPVGLFTPDEAVAYLATALAAHGRLELPDQLTALATDLGHLPLALSQAVAYLIDADLDCAAYRTLLTDRALSLTDVLPDPSGLPDDQATTTAAAWALSVDRADQIPPAGLTRPLMQLTSILAPNGIPAPVLVSTPALAYLTEHRSDTVGRACTEEATTQDVSRVLRTLHRLSLLDHTPRNRHQAVRVHQLVQRATLDTLTTQQRDRLAHAAADALTEAWPEIERDTALAQALRANTEALTRQAENALYQVDGAHPLLFRMGKSFLEAGQLAAAINHWQYLRRASYERLGPDHPDTLTAQVNLASCLGNAGDAAGAISSSEQVLKQMLQVLGPDHPKTLSAQHNLAYWRGEAGDAAGAETAFQQLLSDLLRVHGPDHSDTLSAKHNLAYWRGEAGDAAGAVAALDELLEDCLRVFGSDHPRTLAARANLADWRGEAGDAASAVDAYTHLLRDCQRVLGPDHPRTLATQTNLASWRLTSGDLLGAEAALDQLLECCLRVLGPDHPDTLQTRHTLARCQGEAGVPARAATSFQELLADRVRVLGADHPTTLRTRSSLARWRGEAGDAASAVADFDRLLTDRKRVLGADHPATLTTQESLAYWRERALGEDVHLSTD